MKKNTLLLTTKKRKDLPAYVRVVSYLDDRAEARETLKGLSDYDLLWLEPASEIYYFDAEDLAAIEQFVRNGGGFLVTGGLGRGFLFRTILEEMLPVKAIFQEDEGPQMSVRDVKRFADSVWPGSGEIVVDEGHRLLRGTGLVTGTKLTGNYVSLSKPGSRIIARFNTYELVQAKPDLWPRLVPFISTWVWHGGRTVHVAADVEMFPREVDVWKLVSNIIEFVGDKPERGEILTHRLEYLEGMMLEFHQRMELLAMMGIDPDRDDFCSIRDSISRITGSVKEHANTPVETLHELESAVQRWEKLIEGMEAEVFRSAFDAYRTFYHDLARADADNLFDEQAFESLRYRGELAKLSFNSRAYFEAGKRYSALSRVISDARDAHSQAVQK